MEAVEAERSLDILAEGDRGMRPVVIQRDEIALKIDDDAERIVRCAASQHS